MNEMDWLLETKQLEKTATTYEEKAFYQELEYIIREQYKRIEQAEGELDGTLWSPKKW